jgi:hypothetical protein
MNTAYFITFKNLFENLYCGVIYEYDYVVEKIFHKFQQFY